MPGERARTAGTWPRLRCPGQPLAAHTPAGTEQPQPSQGTHARSRDHPASLPGRTVSQQAPKHQQPPHSTEAHLRPAPASNAVKQSKPQELQPRSTTSTALLREPTAPQHSGGSPLALLPEAAKGLCTGSCNTRGAGDTHKLVRTARTQNIFTPQEQLY